MQRLACIFFLTLAASWMLTRTLQDADAPPARPLKSHDRIAGERHLIHSPDELSSWIDLRAPDPDPDAGTREEELAGWTTDQLRTALNRSLGDPRCSRAGAAAAAARSLMAEWTRREPEAAWQWLVNLPPGPTRHALASGLDQGWPAESAGDALLQIMAIPDLRKADIKRLPSLVLTQAAAQGHAAMAGWMARLEEHGMWRPDFEVTFPQGFDFAALLESGTDRDVPDHGIGGFAAAWLAQDPDAALFELGGSHDVFSAILEAEDAQALDWARRLGATTSRRHGDGEDWTLAFRCLEGLPASPALLRACLSAMPDAELSSYMHRAAAVAYIKEPDIPLALEFLAASTQDPEERFVQLEAMMTSRLRGGAGRLHEAKLRRILGSWNFPPERTEPLIQRMIHGNR
ncbi:hypothetical protein OJ996_00570 [Luteolibacter sp. GHJ8]|uniref:HEAT repeat domain-containing protein n=1 Tax=Luteolibacter rhizosphaerae TaxID=2989719 RepID=A0ABT3FXA5_9BACT|nr:hypothetical protein [Luteolibacter rhizosphaerae]MCW1912047.1 hypothetical protein [Luteolibacter rhizosphaerae]